jgi:hypothetical protein
VGLRDWQAKTAFFAGLPGFDAQHQILTSIREQPGWRRAYRSLLTVMGLLMIVVMLRIAIGG